MVALAVLAAALTSLHVTVWPQGTGGPSHAWTLRCEPAHGTLPHPAQACARLALLDDPFRPVPAGVACSEVYGGPQVARVTGVVRGRKVWAVFRRRDGCETARWGRVSFLLR